MHQAQKENDWREKNEWKDPAAATEDDDSQESWLIQFSSDEEDENNSISSDDHIESSDYDGDCEDNDEANTDKCVICLVPEIGSENRAYASGCFHKFCFKCLLEWSKVRPTCPLCKRAFDRIVYDCHSNTDFKEYYLKQQQQQQQQLNQERQLINYEPPTPPGSPDSANNNNNNSTTAASIRQIANEPLSKASWIVGKQCAPVLFRALVYANQWYVDPTLTQTQTQTSEEESEGAVTIHYASQAFMNQERFRTQLTSTQWYRDNEPLLMAWVARELCALALVANSNILGASTASGFDLFAQLDKVLLVELLNKLVKLLVLQLLDKLVYDEDDLSVVASVAELLHLPKRIARHFVHEMAFFLAAQSADMVEYDARAVYFERAKAMNRKRYLSALMLPVNLTRYRLVPPRDDAAEHERMPVQFGVDMARNFVAAGLDKDDYVKRILMLHVHENAQDQTMATTSHNNNKRTHEDAMYQSDDSVISSSSSSSEDEERMDMSDLSDEDGYDSDDDDELLAAQPEPPPNSPAINQAIPESKWRKLRRSSKKLAIMKHNKE